MFASAFVLRLWNSLDLSWPVLVNLGTESGNAGERLLSAKSIDDEDWPKKFKLR